MTSIGAHQKAALQGMQPSSMRLAVGQSVQARVIGPTRHGLSVLVGKETFQLHAPSRLAGAETLTLQGTASAPASGQSTLPSDQQVRIIAQDGQLLSKPIEAQLTPVVQASKPGSSTIVQTNVVRVAATPVSPEGKVLGPKVTLQIQVPADEPVASATPGQARPATRERPASTTNATHQAPADIGRSVTPQAQSAGQSQVNAAHDRGVEAKIRLPVQTDSGQIPKAVSASNLHLTSPASASVAPDIKQGAVGDVNLRGDLQRQQLGSVAPILSAEGEPVPLKSTMNQAVVNYKMGAMVEAKSLTKGAQTPDLPMAAGHRQSVSASVVGRNGSGNILLESQGQLMRIEQPVDLPPGTSLQVTFVPAMLAGEAGTQRPASENPASLLSRLIGLLDDIDRASRQTMETDRQPSTRQLPAPDKHLASRFLGLLTADSGGDPKTASLFSSPDRGTASSKSEQIQTLVRELGGMASEPLSDGWKSLTLPLGTDQNHAVSLYFRGHELDPDDEASHGEADPDGAKRALFDVSFSQIGRCQIDVLCQERRFDFLIRSEKPIRSEDRQDLTDIFVSACEIAGTKGEIAFNVGSFFEPARSSVISKELRT
ncbi:MAG: hypothetical protein AAGA21_12390 [Pseudomonadota bacterium]